MPIGNELAMYTKSLFGPFHISPSHSNDLSLYVDFPIPLSNSPLSISNKHSMTTKSKTGVNKLKLLASILSPHGYLIEPGNYKDGLKCT